MAAATAEGETSGEIMVAILAEILVTPAAITVQISSHSSEWNLVDDSR
ncbi:MAG: hypothetical protein KDA65_07395 [Planctomycetaceae bacterium]|nr:hypothetical protein [Planctomycetaceae bacterium]